MSDVVHMERLKVYLQDPTVTKGHKARRLIDHLFEALSNEWLFSHHLALIVDCFRHYGKFKSSPYFGTYNVDLVVVLFAKVVDLHNFDLVLNVLTEFEISCVYCRLGWLNVWNPCKPEGSWELDLTRFEERVVAKCLVR